MWTLARFAVRLLKREDGPTAVEYGIMLALIIVVCIASHQYARLQRQQHVQPGGQRTGGCRIVDV